MPGSGRRTGPPSERERDAAVHALDTAYADGQIDAEEHQERLHQVLEATEVRELSRQLLDLQGPGLPAPPESSAPPRPGLRERTRSGLTYVRRELRADRQRLGGLWARLSRRAKVGAVTGTLLLATFVGVVVVEAREDRAERIALEERAAVPSATAEGFEVFCEDYEQEFGTTLVGSVRLDDDHSTVEVPIEGQDRRYQQWSREGATFRDTSRRSSGQPPIDLAQVDTGALAENLEVARRELGVPDPDRSTLLVDIGPHDPEPRISIQVRNAFQESAWLVTDLAGNELHRRPFEIPDAAPGPTG